LQSWITDCILVSINTHLHSRFIGVPNMCINLGQNILVLITKINNLTAYNHETQKQLFNLTNEHRTIYWIHRQTETSW